MIVEKHKTYMLSDFIIIMLLPFVNQFTKAALQKFQILCEGTILCQVRHSCINTLSDEVYRIQKNIAIFIDF